MISRGFIRDSGGVNRREKEVLSLIAEGYEEEEIAKELRLAVKTVKKHELSLVKKLDQRDISSAVDYSLRHGLIDMYEVLSTRFSRANREFYRGEQGEGAP